MFTSSYHILLIGILSDRDDRRIFFLLGREILASTFLGSLIYVGIFWGVISFNAFWKFLWLENSAWDFWGVKFWSRLFGVLFEAQRILGGFSFLPLFTHPFLLKSRVPPPPPPGLLDIKSQPQASIRAFKFKMAAHLSTKCRRH